MIDLNLQTILWIVYGIGAVFSYFLTRRCNKNACQNSSYSVYNYSHVVCNFIIAFGSWIAFIIVLFIWIGNESWRSESHKNPPKWL